MTAVGAKRPFVKIGALILQLNSTTIIRHRWVYIWLECHTGIVLDGRQSLRRRLRSLVLQVSEL